MKDKEEVTETTEAVANATAEANWTHTRVVLRIVFIVLVVAALLWILYALEGVILLIVLAVFFAYLVAPLVELARRPFTFGGRERRMPRAMAIGLVYLVIFGSLGTAVYLVLPSLGNQVTEFAKEAPNYISSTRERARALEGIFDRLQLPLSARKSINDFLGTQIESLTKFTSDQGLSTVATVVTTLLTYVPWLILIPILAFFLLKDVEAFRRSALQMLPTGRWRWRGDEFFQDVNTTLAAYIRAQLSACLIIGVICTLGFLLLGVPYWLALGILAGVLEFIPLAGPLTVAVIAAAVSSFHSFGEVMLVLLFLGVLRVLQDYIIYPRLIGHGIHLHPLAVILAILSGAELAGVAGIFLAIPVIAIATVSYRHWLEHRGSEGLVADILRPVDEAESTPQQQSHPQRNTTPEDMARARPDLTTDKLRWPEGSR